jgi:iron complex outermembrane receptor protein
MTRQYSLLISTTCLFIVAGGLGLSTGAARAQSTDAAASPQPAPSTALSEVVVTAEKRAEPLQTTPLPITAFSAATLEKNNIHSLEDLTTLDSSIKIGEGTGQAVPFIRGVGNPVRNIGDEASSSIYIDGVYISRLPAAFFELPAVSQIEVLKGPQGTLYGRNSEGGLISIVTRDPTRQPALDASVGYGNYDTTRASLYASDSFGDKLKANLSLLEVNQAQGWGQDVVTGGQNGFEDASIARTKVMFDPWAGTHFTFSADYFFTRSTDGLSSLAYEGTTQGLPTAPHTKIGPLSFYDTDNSLNNVDRSYGGGLSLKVQQDLHFADLISITAYRRTDEKLIQDGDDSPVNYTNAVFNDAALQTSEELRLQSKRNSPFDWVLGFFYIDQYGAYSPILENGLSLGPYTAEIYAHQSDTSYAGFGQTTFHLPASTNLTLGLRYTTDDVSGGGHTDLATGTSYSPGKVTAADRGYDRATYKAGLDHRFTADTLGYVSYSTGFKAGVFNTVPFSSTPVLPETITAYEIGEKTELFNHRLRLNADVFDEEIRNLQVQAVGPTAPLSLVLINASRAHSRGVEFDGAASIASALSATFGFTVLDAKYDSFADAPFYAPINVSPYGNGPLTLGNASGDYLPRAPDFSFSVGLDYKLSNELGDWDVNGNYVYSDKYYWDPDNRHAQAAMGLLDANLTFIPRGLTHWSISLWGKNLTDVQYYWGENETAGTVGTPGVVAPPRTFGFTLNYKL